MELGGVGGWVRSGGMAYHLGLEGLSLWLVILTTFLTPLCLLGSWTSIHSRVREFVVLMLLLEAGMIGVFVALDLFLFYIFWEAILIPLYFPVRLRGPRRPLSPPLHFLPLPL